MVLLETALAYSYREASSSYAKRPIKKLAPSITTLASYSWLAASKCSSRVSITLELKILENSPLPVPNHLIGVQSK